MGAALAASASAKATQRATRRIERCWSEGERKAGPADKGKKEATSVDFIRDARPPDHEIAGGTRDRIFSFGCRSVRCGDKYGRFHQTSSLPDTSDYSWLYQVLTCSSDNY